MSDLNYKKTELASVLNSLRYDPVAMEIEARTMGLYEPEQKVMYFSSISRNHNLPEAGMVLILENDEQFDGLFYRIISLIAGLIILVPLLPSLFRMR